MKDESTCCFFRFINGFLMEYYKEMLFSKESFKKKKGKKFAGRYEIAFEQS